MRSPVVLARPGDRRPDLASIAVRSHMAVDGGYNAAGLAKLGLIRAFEPQLNLGNSLLPTRREALDGKVWR